MSATRVRLVSPLRDELSAELAKRLYFISADIDGFELVWRDGAVEAVDIAISGDSVAAEQAARSISEKINRVVEDEIRNQRVLPRKVLWQSRRGGPFPDPYPELAAAGVVFSSGEGQLACGEPLLTLMDYLDGRLRRLAMDLGHAREYRYPTLLPAKVLERFGYFASFPQFVMFTTRLHNDSDVYSKFLHDYLEIRRLPDSLAGYCRNYDYCLPPTMCYHTYHQHAGRSLPVPGSVVTSRGKAFRFESRYWSGFERLWDFTIREIVFLGSAEYAASCREHILRAACALAEELGLSGRCEVANDYFFGNASVADSLLSQRMMELKYELLLDTADGRTVAAGSFNLHGRFFAEAFGLALDDGSPAATGCAGFGLERLTYAFICQHGANPAGWPPAVRAEVC